MEPSNIIAVSGFTQTPATKSASVAKSGDQEHASNAVSNLVSSANPSQTDPNALNNPQTLAPERERIDQAVKHINESFQATKRTLEFNIDEDSQEMVIQIKDKITHEVIRQIPSEDMLRLAKSLDEIKGLLFKESA